MAEFEIDIDRIDREAEVVSADEFHVDWSEVADKYSSDEELAQVIDRELWMDEAHHEGCDCGCDNRSGPYGGEE